MYYYLGPGETEHINILGGVDLRTDTQIKNGTGYSFFTSKEPVPGLYQLDTNLTNDQKNQWKQWVGNKEITKDNVIDVLWETLTDEADPNGRQAPRPLIPCINGDLELHLGGHSLVKNEKPNKSSKYWQKLKKICQDEYKLNKRLAKEGKVKATLPEQVLWNWSKKCNEDPQILVPGSDPIIKPETSYTESFNKANGALGPDLTWTVKSNSVVVLNNRGAAGSANVWNWARAEHDLSSNDNYAQIDVIVASGFLDWFGANCRYQSAADSCYTGLFMGWGRVYVYKIVTGTIAVIPGQSYTSYSWAATVVFKIQANGSTITTYADGNIQHNFTDTSVTTGTRGGIIALDQQDSVDASGDSFLMTDLAASWYFTPWKNHGLRFRRP